MSRQQKLKFVCRGVVCHVTGAAEIRGSEAAEAPPGRAKAVAGVAKKKKGGWGVDVWFCGQAVQSTQPTVARQCNMRDQEKRESVETCWCSLRHPHASTAGFKNVIPAGDDV